MWNFNDEWTTLCMVAEQIGAFSATINLILFLGQICTLSVCVFRCWYEIWNINVQKQLSLFTAFIYLSVWLWNSQWDSSCVTERGDFDAIALYIVAGLLFNKREASFNMWIHVPLSPSNHLGTASVLSGCIKQAQLLPNTGALKYKLFPKLREADISRCRAITVQSCTAYGGNVIIGSGSPLLHFTEAQGCIWRHLQPGKKQNGLLSKGCTVPPSGLRVALQCGCN